VLAAIEAAAAEGMAALIAARQSDALARACGSVVVMAGGRIVCQGPPGEVLADPATWDLGAEEPTEQRLTRLMAEAGAA
jgi:ABC-type glutathione transport system ATPase component